MSTHIVLVVLLVLGRVLSAGHVLYVRETSFVVVVVRRVKVRLALRRRRPGAAGDVDVVGTHCPTVVGHDATAAL